MLNKEEIKKIEKIIAKFERKNWLCASIGKKEVDACCKNA